MQLVTLTHPRSTWAVRRTDGRFVLPAGEAAALTLSELMRDWTAWQADVAELAGDEQAESLTGDEVTLAPPLPRPGKIICIGKNYVEHAAEMGSEPPSLPVVFSKFNSALIPDGTPVVLPEISQQVDYEAELVVVIGRPGRQIAREHAWEHVFGYCAGNDISARDWQKGRPGGQWLLGKTFDTFAPMGPGITPASEIADPHQLDIVCRINGEIMQQANTRELIFGIDFLISHLSQFMTLEVGDLIFTGTPAGVGAGRQPPRFLRAGDQVEVEISGMPVLRNPVVAASGDAQATSGLRNRHSR